MFLEWNELPHDLKNDEVNKYYKILNEKRKSIILKRIFDLICSSIMLVFLLPFFVIIGLAIKLDSKGPVMFKQVRITQYGKKFKIFKFRTMVVDAEKLGAQVTIDNDDRITRVGKLIRGLRLDEMPQLINVFMGEMSFVGTRPEVEVFVNNYTDAMKATLLLPAGITSRASIEYKDESKILNESDNIKNTYIQVILPEKMKWNLEYLKNFNILEDFKIMVNTVIAVVR